MFSAFVAIFLAAGDTAVFSSVGRNGAYALVAIEDETVRTDDFGTVLTVGREIKAWVALQAFTWIANITVFDSTFGTTAVGVDVEAEVTSDTLGVVV